MSTKTETYQKTFSAYVWSNVFNAPLWALYSLLPFIFLKDLQATPIQITLLVSIKPAVAIISFYWSSLINKRIDFVKPNIFWATFIGLFPCFVFPLMQSIWFFLVAYAFYMMAVRAVIPGWMEILKINVPELSRSRVYSYGASINYLTGLFFPLFVAHWMDSTAGMWRWMFVFAGCSNAISLLLLLRIPLPEAPALISPKPAFSFKETLITPWINFGELMTKRRDFARFQIVFMLGGLGIMIMQPALPYFFVDVLQLSYTELAIALSICKGLGFALTSRGWAHLINKINLFSVTSLVTLLAAIYPFFIMMAEQSDLWIYAAYFVYGVMQAGSEMSWNLSGPIFSKEEESSFFSGVNVMLVGIRGCIGPVIGTYLCTRYDCFFPMYLAAIASIAASAYGAYCTRRFADQSLAKD